MGTVFNKKHVHALNEANFYLKKGEIVAIVGESGSGKSTTVKVLSRLEDATAGEIIIDGEDILKKEAGGASLGFRKKVQMIFQDPFGSLNPVHSIGHHIERPLRIHRIVPSNQVAAKVAELLETVGLTPADDYAERFPHELSGGQRQRVAIARALAVNPEIILADEPTSMLDVSIRMGVLNLMKKLKEEKGISFIYITHDLASARYIGDRTIVMYAGHMVESTDSSSLMENPAHPYTQVLKDAVPSPEKSILDDPGHKRGDIPSLVDPKPGCPFVPRCPYVMDICRQKMPKRVFLSDEHWIACHKYTEER